MVMEWISGVKLTTLQVCGCGCGWVVWGVGTRGRALAMRRHGAGARPEAAHAVLPTPTLGVAGTRASCMPAARALTRPCRRTLRCPPAAA